MKMKRMFGILAGIAVVAVFFGAACEKAQMQDAGTAPAAEEVGATTEDGVPSTEMTTPGTMATIGVGSADFSVEIAVTDEERARGLMGREALPAKTGMWFVFPETVQDDFWMKDTLVALDIVYVGDDMKVVHIIENAVPESTELLASPVPYRYVLEIPAGSVEEFDIKVGDVAEKRIGPR